MCNLYSMTKSQAAIVAITRAMHDRTGNLPPLPGIILESRDRSPAAKSPAMVRILATQTRQTQRLHWLAGATVQMASCSARFPC